MVQLYPDAPVKLELGTAQDILYVKPQDQRELHPYDFKIITVSTVAYAIEHKAERALLDFSRNRLEFTEQEYRSLLVQLVVGLMRSPVQKVARIATEDVEREWLFQSVCDQIRAAIKLNIEIRSFRERTEALRWLKQ